MRERKIRAGYFLLREKSSLRREQLFIRVISLGIFVCFWVLRASFFSGEINFFGFEAKRNVLMLPAFAGTAVLLYFYFSHRLHFSGRLYSIQDSEFPKPFTLLKFGTVVRFMAFSLIMRCLSLLWLLFFLSPAGCVAVLIFRSFAVGGSIQRLMFFTLIAAFILLLIMGYGFYFYISGRYFLSELLFIRCPGQNPFEILKNSAGFTNEVLSEISFFRLRSIFGRGSVRGKMLSVLYCSDLFYNRRFYENYGIFRSTTFPEPS